MQSFWSPVRKIKETNSSNFSTNFSWVNAKVKLPRH